MKKIILALMALAIVSCGKIEQGKVGKTYSFTDNFGLTQTVTSSHPTNSSVSFIISEYNGKWKLSENRIDNPDKGKTFNFVANHDAEYLTVRIHVLYNGAQQRDSYLPKRYYLSEGSNTEIVYDYQNCESVSNEPIAE